MGNMQKSYIILCIVLALFAFGTEYYASTFGFTTKVLEIIDPATSQIIKKPFIDSSTGHKIFKMISTFLYAGCISILITIFIVNKIDTSQKQKRVEELDQIQKNIRENIFDEVLKKFVDNQIYDTIKDDILKSNLLKKDAKWIFKFKELERGNIEL